MVSELAALSKRKEYSALDLEHLSGYATILCGPTNLADILRYASVGVNVSADMVAHNGIRFGGFEDLLYAESISCTVSNDGSMFDYDLLATRRP